MKNWLIYFIIAYICGCCSVNAFEVVYPKTQNVVIDAPRTAFIGNEQETGNLKINGQKVQLHSSGGFKYPVELNFGKNVFVIDNGVESKVYTIVRNQYIHQSNLQFTKPIFYESPKNIVTLDNNTILRSTPVDKGLNRLSHLPSGISFKSTGEYNGFYKVLLGRDDIGWISKNQASVSNVQTDYVSDIGYLYSEGVDTEIHKFITGGIKLPYVLSEDDEGLNLVIYGVSSEKYKFGKYEFNIRHLGNLQGYSAYYDDENNLMVVVNKNRKRLKDVSVTIDAGHGGREYGAIGCLGDREKDINLKIALKLRETLVKAGAKVYMTRDIDKYLSLNDRVEVTKKNGSEIFISIHSNALADASLNKDISGTEVYYFYPQAKALAKCILESLTLASGTKNNGVKAESFAVIRNSSAVSVLVEVAYIINPEENVLLRDEVFQQRVADGIFHGVENYLK